MRDIAGQRFGNTVAIRRTDKKKGGTYVWECKCDCGNTHYTNLGNLVSGGTKSCGCLRKARMSALGKKSGSTYGGKNSKDMTGQRFSRLVVIEKTEQRIGTALVWKCQCDCGEICFVKGYNLRKGLTQSCGCMRVEAGLKIGSILQESRPLIDGTDVNMIKDMSIRSNNKTGVRGVCWDKSRQCYIATIAFKGKQYNLGRFGDLEEAKQMRKLAEEKLYGEFLKWYYSTRGLGENKTDE